MTRNCLLYIIKSNGIVFSTASNGKESHLSEEFHDSKILQTFLELIYMGNYRVLFQDISCHYFFEKVITSYSVLSLSLKIRSRKGVLGF